MGLMLPKTFSGHGYQVTVNADRSIKVKQGDWLSKYTMAIWGDYTREHIGAFKRKEGRIYKDIANPDLIRTGEILYVRAPLPGENGIGIFPGEDKPGGSLPPTGPGAEPAIPVGRVTEFLRWLKRTYTPDPEWAISKTGSGDLGFSFVNAKYQQIEIIHTPSQVLTWFHCVAVGLNFGYPDSMNFNGSLSPTWFPAKGTILRSPLYSKLVLDDFRHWNLSCEFGIGFVIGGSITLMCFGMGFPPSRILDTLRNYFYHGNPAIFGTLLRKGAPSGLMVMGGGSLITPGLGFAIRAGLMYDRGYLGI